MEPKEVDSTCGTFDTILCKWSPVDLKTLANRSIYIEGYTIVPKMWVTKKYEVIFQIRVSVLDVVSKSDVVLTMAKHSRALKRGKLNVKTS